MTISLDIVDQPAARNGGAAAWGRVVLAVGVVVVVLVAAVVMSREPPARQGRQLSSTSEIALRQASVRGWEPLLPTAGRLRDGFPQPMVWRSDGICLGFARADFAAETRRPSLARCERNPPNRPLAADEIRLLHSIESGFDTWHFIEAADHVDRIAVSTSTGQPVSADRLHLSGSTIGLLLENGRDLASIRWSTGSQTFQCRTDPAAWRTSQFCAG